MKDGYYSKLNSIIRQQKIDGTVIFDIDNIATKIDLSKIDRKELETRCSRAMASVAAYQNGLRSIVHGKGVYVDYKRAKSPVVLEKLLNNLHCDTDRKTIMVQVIEALINGMNENEQGQGVYIPNENNELMLFEEKSKEELIEILKELIG